MVQCKKGVFSFVDDRGKKTSIKERNASFRQCIRDKNNEMDNKSNDESISECSEQNRIYRQYIKCSNNGISI